LFTISGFTNAQNNGTFFCTASTSTTITLNNGQGVAETATKTMTMVPYITIPVPASAAFLSLGISDGVLNDNTGSYSLTAFQFANEGFFTSTGWLGDRGFFRQFPAGQVSPESMKDFTSFQSTNINQSVALATYFLPQMVLGVPLIRGKVGQLFPHGGQNFGGNPTGAGQNFPY